jgi:hypothetical protein
VCATCGDELALPGQVRCEDPLALDIPDGEELSLALRPQQYFPQVPATNRVNALTSVFLAQPTQLSSINAQHEVQQLHRRTGGHKSADGSAARPGASAVLRRMRTADDRASAS